MKTLLITGANGFMGQSIVKNLMGEFDITATGRQDKSVVPNVDYVSADFSDTNFVPAFNNHKFDYIIHVGACVSHDNTNKNLISANCLGIMNVADLAIKNNAKIIFISGVPVIGTPIQIPITENHPTNPISVYHASKLFGEYITGIYNGISLRIPSPIGVGMPDNKILPVFISNAIKNRDITLMGNGGRIQNYIDVADIANAVRNIINSDKNISGVYNLAGAHSYSNLELAQICIDVCKSHSNIVFSGTDALENDKWVISTSKAYNDFGFVPKIDIRETIKNIKNYYENINNV